MYLSINSSVSQQFKNRGKYLMIIIVKFLDVFYPKENKTQHIKLWNMKKKFKQSLAYLILYLILLFYTSQPIYIVQGYRQRMRLQRQLQADSSVLNS